MQKVYCAKLQRKMQHATKKMISNYIKEFTKKIKKKTLPKQQKVIEESNLQKQCQTFHQILDA